MAKKKEIYICVTLYHLYLSLLYIKKNQSINNSILILNANDEQIYKHFKNLEPKLKETGYKVNVRLRNRNKDILGIENIITRHQFKTICTMFRDDISNKYVLYNFAWNLQYIYSTANLYYRKCNKAVFIEEGALTPINPPQPEWKVFLKKITGTVTEFYKEQKVEGIYVQNATIYPKDWQNKLKQLDLKKLTSNLNPDFVNKLIDIFIDSEQIEELRKCNKGIIFTQPLSEDGYITEEEKKHYFYSMADYYSKYGSPVVKLHPRDLTNYEFPKEVLILPGYFPSELLGVAGINFKYAVGICTSAVPTALAERKLNINDNFLNDKILTLKDF